MNFWYTCFLIGWCILIIGNCYQGQNLITPNNIESNIYIYFQLLSTATSVMIAIAIASYLCIQYCYENDFDSDDVLSFVILPLSILQITMFALIGNNIEAVSGESDTKNFKIVLSICGGLSAIPVFYSLYKIIKFLFPTAEEKEERANKEKLRKIRQANSHKFQQQKDIKEENEQHRAQLELQQLELQRQNELIIQQANKKIYEDKYELDKQKAKDEADRAVNFQRLAAERFRQQLAAQKEIDKNAEYKQQNEYKQRDFKTRLERENLEYESLMEQKAREEEDRKRKLEQMEAELKYRDSDKEKQRKLAELEYQLSLKEIERQNVNEELKLDYLKKELDKSTLRKATREEKERLKKQISDTTSQINRQLPLLPGMKAKPGRIAQLPQDDDDTDPCAEMKQRVEEMKDCGDSGQAERDFFNERRNTLFPKCKDNYTEMDKYEQRCKETKRDKCKSFERFLPDMEDCKDGSFLRSAYKNDKEYAHCNNEHKILDKYIKTCKGEDVLAKTGLNGVPLIEIPKAERGSSENSVNATVAQYQDEDDHERFNYDVKQKESEPIPPLSPGPQTLFDRIISRTKDQRNQQIVDNGNDLLALQDDTGRIALTTCQHLTEFNDTIQDCDKGKQIRQRYLNMSSQLRDRIKHICPRNDEIIEQTEKKCQN
jgi:hypothetical protein